MSGNALSVTVGADVTDLRTKLALAQSDVKAFTTETRNLAQQMRDASDSARAALLPQLEASAKAAGDARAQAASLTAELRTNASAVNDNASALGSNRMALMELEHSARATMDALAAGADPMRVLAMEAPRAAQALSNLGPGAMAAIVSPAGAAAVAAGVLTAALGYLAYSSLEAANALHTAHEAMLLAGNLNPTGIKAYDDDIKNLVGTFGLGKTAAEEAAAAMGELRGPASQYHDQILAIAVAYSQLKGIALPTAIAEVVKEANGGSQSFLKWAEQVGVVTQRQKDLIAQMGHDQIGAFEKIIDSIGTAWGHIGDRIATAKKELKEYFAVAAAMGQFAPPGSTPEDYGVKAPAPEEVHPTSGSPVIDQADEQAAKTASAYNQKLVERQGLLHDIDIIEAKLAKDTDPKQRLADEEALATAQKQAAQMHTTLEQQAFDIQMGHLKQIAASAEQGSSQRIDALRQEAALAGQYYGQNSAQYQQAEAQIAEAVREQQTKNRQEYQKTEDELQKLIATAQRFSVSLHSQSLALSTDLRRGTDSVDRALDSFNRNNTRLTQTLQRNQQQVNAMIVKPYLDAFHGMSSAFNQSVMGMINGSMTFQQAMQNVAMGVLDTFVQMGLDLLENWIETQIEKAVLGEVTQDQSAAGEIMAAAAVAAANTFASISAIPMVGPAMAPEAAEAAYMQTMAYTGRLGFAVGTPNVPADMLANIHAGEIIVPRTFSDGIRSGELSLGRANDNASGAAADVHVHLPRGAVQVEVKGRISAADLTDLQGAVEGVISKAARAAHRKGAFA